MTAAPPLPDRTLPARRFCRLLVVPLAALSLANTGPNEDWWVLSTGDAEGNAYLIDGIAKLEVDAARTYHAHFFYRIPVEGVKSAQIEFFVNCDEGTLREGRYNDFDEQRSLLGSGDNFETNAFRRPIPGTIGDDIVTFSCANDRDRSQRYAKIDGDVDLWALGEHLLQGSRPQQINQP